MGWDQIVILVLIGVFALVKWLVENAGSTDESRSQKPEDQADGEESSREGSSNPPEEYEERMRRLREALGLPEEGAAPVKRKPVQPPAPRVVEKRPPVQPTPGPGPLRMPGSPVPRTDIREKLKQARQAISPTPAPRAVIREPVPTLAPPVQPSLTPVPIPQTASLGASVPSMSLVNFPALGGLSSEFNETVAGGGIGSSARKPGWFGAPLRVALRSPEAIRQAVIMREILGPPKSLQ